MKKRTAFIGAILSLIPLGQPLIIKSSIALSISGIVLSFSNKVQAEDARFYYMRALEKSNAGDLYGAICEYTKAISVNPPSDSNTAMLYVNRGNAKANLGDYKGSLDDYNKIFNGTEYNKESVLTYSKYWIEAQKKINIEKGKFGLFKTHNARLKINNNFYTCLVLVF